MKHPAVILKSARDGIARLARRVFGASPAPHHSPRPGQCGIESFFGHHCAKDKGHAGDHACGTCGTTWPRAERTSAD